MAVTKLYRSQDYQYNQAIRMVMYNIGSEPAWTGAGIPPGTLYFQTNLNIPFYAYREDPSGEAIGWDYFFGYMRANLGVALTVDTSNDRLLLYQAGTGTYKLITPGTLQSAIEDIHVKMKSTSSTSSFLSTVLQAAEYGGIYYDIGSGTESTMYSHFSVAGLSAASGGSVALTNILPVSFAGDTVVDASAYITLDQANKVMKFISLVDTPATFSANYLLRANSGATALEWIQYVPTSAGGTGANLSASQLGSLFYFNTSGNVFTALSQGTLNQVLASQGAAALPQWIDAWTTDGYADVFSVSDWSGSFPDYTITVAAVTHGLGVGYGYNVKVYENVSGVWHLVEVETRINASTGAVTIYASGKFDGYISITKVK